MKNSGIDILMITFNRPVYTEMALTRLLETCHPDMRVWLWHNGDDRKTISIVNSLSGHPRIRKFYHSVANKKLREPTNWFWSNATGRYLCKVDDDCLMPDGWAEKLQAAHDDVHALGIISAWLFPPQDDAHDFPAGKIQSIGARHQIMRNCWVGGSGYMMKRECMERQGLLHPTQNFTDYCIKLAAKGWANGWYYPFIYMDHMDDPRSRLTLLKTDADVAEFMPLTAKTFGVNSLGDWDNSLRVEAAYLQRAGIDPRCYLGWRRKLRNLIRKLNFTDR